MDMLNLGEVLTMYFLSFFTLDISNPWIFFFMVPLKFFLSQIEFEITRFLAVVL